MKAPFKGKSRECIAKAISDAIKHTGPSANTFTVRVFITSSNTDLSGKEKMVNGFIEIA